MGYPFIGQAGKVLDRLIDLASGSDESLRYGITNLVGCIPLDEKRKTRPPTDEEVDACAPRLMEIETLSAAKYFILLGKVPAKQWERLTGGVNAESNNVLCLDHPSFIARSGERTPMYSNVTK